MEDSVCHHEKFEYFKFKCFENKHQKSYKRFQIDISCRFGSSCAYFHIDNSGKGNKQITNEIEIDVENLENVTKDKNIPAQSYCTTSVRKYVNPRKQTGLSYRRSSCFLQQLYGAATPNRPEIALQVIK